MGGKVNISEGRLIQISQYIIITFLCDSFLVIQLDLVYYISMTFLYKLWRFKFILQRKHWRLLQTLLFNVFIAWEADGFTSWKLSFCCPEDRIRWKSLVWTQPPITLCSIASSSPPLLPSDTNVRTPLHSLVWAQIRKRQQQQCAVPEDRPLLASQVQGNYYQ